MSEDSPETGSLWVRHRWWLVLLLLLIVAAGVGRWTQLRQQEAVRAEAEKSKPRLDDKKKDKDGKKKDEPKPDFSTFRLAIQPGEGAAKIEVALDPDKEKEQDQGKGKDRSGAKEREYEAIHLVKPGHWATASLSAQANNFDFTGQLATGASDPQGNWIGLENSPYRLYMFRPAQLPKGQPKQLEVSWFVPRGSSKSWIASHLRDRRGRSDVKTEMDRLEHMPQYQYYFFVLARDPKQYGYLKVLDTIRPSWGDVASGLDDEDYYYRVLLPQVVNRIPLPAQPLTWTSLAYILWDDVDPKLFRPEQEQALLDWLHWGGQIIISGPRTLDVMRGSFLEPYLPAGGGATRELDDAGLKELSDHWTVPEHGAPGRPLVAIKPWAAVELVKRDGASFLPGAGELVAERRVGRGRIVVTAFRLQQRDLLNWRSFDSFLNNALLRRPPREFIDGRNLKPHVTWRDQPQRRLDSRLVTGVRYFTRDGDPLEDRTFRPVQARIEDDVRVEQATPVPSTPVPTNFNSQFLTSRDYDNQNPSAAPRRQFRYERDLDPQTIELEFGQESDETAMAKRDSGVGGWSDNSDVAEAARQSLKDAAGIDVPQPTFVLVVLFAYLMVLVPLNWGVFKLLGKVEWAWIAAPVIAVVCSGLVIKLARLDIGFAQSKTEIAVVELQPSYSRAHTTRYTALYTSLSTTYDVTYTDSTTLAQPFATQAQLLANQARPIVAFGRTSGEEGLKLSGFELSSNSTGMLHSEQMLDLGGALDWLAAADDGLPQVANNTRLTLHGAAVLRRVGDEPNGKPALETAWIGKFQPSQTATIRFRSAAESNLAAERDAAPITAESVANETLSVRTLADLAQQGQDMATGDVRLVAWLDEELPGVTIEPVAAQARHAALLVAHLEYGPQQVPQPDKNTRADLRELPKDDDVGTTFEALPEDSN